MIRKIPFILLWGALLLGITAFPITGFAQTAADGPRIALVIGNSDYPTDSLFGDIRMAERDAQLMADSLRKVGFEVILETNASKMAMYNRLLDFESKIEEGGTALIYFAGHGIEFEKKNYLMGTNALFQDRDMLGEESLEADTIIKKIQRRNPKTAIFLLDCCRQPPTESWLRSLNQTRGAASVGLAEIETGPGLVVGFAASAGNLANDRLDGENGPYATALVKHMQSGEELMRVMRLAARDVNARSIQMKRDHPENSGLVIQEPAVYGQIYHDFFFTANKPAPTAKMPPPSATQEKIRSLALVISIGEYEDLAGLELDREMEVIVNVFNRRCEDVSHVKDPTKAEILNNLKEVTNRMKQQGYERLYLYLTGHGLHRNGTDLVMMRGADTDRMQGEDILMQSELTSLIKDEKFTTILFWDTARDPVDSAPNLLERVPLSLNLRHDNLVTVFSTQVGAQSYLSTSGIGSFAEALSDHFSKVNTLPELFTEMKEQMQKAGNSASFGKQIPVLDGDFAFRFKL